MNIEDFKKETNSKFKLYREEYVKKLEGVLPIGSKRKSRMIETNEAPISDINQRFKQFIMELFTSSNQALIQSSSVHQFCKQFGMDRDHLLNLRDFDERQQYLLNCINKQIQNQIVSEKSEPHKYRKPESQHKPHKNWMKMNTKHQYLQNKIREAFMQALNQEGNQQKIDKFVQQYNQKQNRDDSNQSKSAKLKLNKIPQNDPQKLQVLKMSWNNKAEVQLKDKINKMKSELRDVSYSRKLGRQRYITHQQYMLVAYSQIMRTFNEHKQYNMDRDTILKKYLEREVPLTQNEMKFILNTSPLITKSLNKTKIKTAIENLDPVYLHSIEIKIADQVLNDFNNSISEIKKSRKIYKKQTLNSIMNKLHHLQNSSQSNRNINLTETSRKKRPQSSNHYSNKNANLLCKYSGGYDSLKKLKQNAKLDMTIQKTNMSSQHTHPNQGPRKTQRPKTALNKVSLTNRSAFNNTSEATQKRKRQFLIKSLQMAALRNNFEWIIVENYPNFSSQEVNVPDKQGNTPLFYAIRSQNEQFSMYLLKFGANVNHVCQKGQTPLHVAFKTNNHNIISACLMKNPDLNVICNKGFTPLAHGKIVTLKAFGLMNGVPKANPNQPRYFDNNRLLVPPESRVGQSQLNDLIY